jgi:hypothetical protein
MGTMNMGNIGKMNMGKMNMGNLPDGMPAGMPGMLGMRMDCMKAMVDELPKRQVLLEQESGSVKIAL